jgi:hypothetical protein
LVLPGAAGRRAGRKAVRNGRSPFDAAQVAHVALIGFGTILGLAVIEGTLRLTGTTVNVNALCRAAVVHSAAASGEGFRPHRT